MRGVLDQLKKASRFTGWWTYKISYLLIPLYWLLSGSDLPTGRVVVTFFCLLGYFVSTATFGHIVNDIGDADLDARASKKNLAGSWSQLKRVGLLFALALIQFLFLVGANADLPVFVLATIECILFFSYSFPPTRFKESVLGIFVDSAYAHVIPFLIAILVAPSREGIFPGLAGILIGWQACAGLRGIIGHELEDLASDAASGVRTAVIRLGSERSRNLLFRVVIPVEVTLLCLGLGWLSTWSSIPLLGLGFYLLFLLLKKLKYGTPFGKFDINHQWDRILDPFYRNVLPIFVLIGLILSEPAYWPLLAFHLILFHLPKREDQSGNRLDVPQSKVKVRMIENDGEMAIDIQGAYLTSTLTNRTDVNIYLVVSIDEKNCPVEICYGPNQFSDYWKAFHSEEPPVTFQIFIPFGNSQDGDLLIEAGWENPTTRIPLYSGAVRANRLHSEENREEK